MSLTKVKIGPFAAVFVGDYTSSDPLIEITDISTSPTELYEGYEEQFFVGLSKQLQTGTFIITVPLSFYESDSILVHSLARGLSVGNTNKNTAPENTLYSLLLISEDEESQNSILVEPVRTKRDKRVTKAKTAASSVALLFTAESQSRYDDLITYGTVAELDLLLGVRSPF